MVPETISSLLHQCSKLKVIRNGLCLHSLVFKTGLIADVIISNHVLNMYAKCGHLNIARKLFDEMPQRNLVSWSAMISGYDQIEEPILALELFSQLPFVPNEYVFASAISACASLVAMRQGQQIHAKSFKCGYGSFSFVCNSLISMYMKCGYSSDALLVYDGDSQLNSVTYNALIAGFLKNQQPEKGFQVFKVMHQQGLVPDRCTFAGLLGICSSFDDLQIGAVMHSLTIKHNLHATPFIGNLLIAMYSNFNLPEEVEKVFRLVQDRDVISWNTFIAACSHSGHHEKGLIAFKEMLNEHRFRPDDYTFSSTLAACAGLASIRHGKQVHAHLIRRRTNQDVGVGNAIVNMYAKCGSIGYAYDVFCEMSDHNLVSWNTIVAGFGNHGLGTRALEIFEQMNRKGVKPDAVTFLGLLTACNHAGLVDEGQFLYNSMERIYGIAPDIEHLSCLIDLLGRARKLHEAEDYMKRVPFGYDVVILGSLLSACRLHGDVVMGQRVARQLLKLHPVTTSPYVLLSNLYAKDEMWDDVADARKMLKVSGLKKEPGHSLIEVKGVFEKFTIGDFSHSRIKEIKYILNTFEEMKNIFTDSILTFSQLTK